MDLATLKARIIEFETRTQKHWLPDDACYTVELVEQSESRAKYRWKATLSLVFSQGMEPMEIVHTYNTTPEHALERLARACHVRLEGREVI